MAPGLRPQLTPHSTKLDPRVVSPADLGSGDDITTESELYTGQGFIIPKHELFRELTHFEILNFDLEKFVMNKKYRFHIFIAEFSHNNTYICDL